MSGRFVHRVASFELYISRVASKWHLLKVALMLCTFLSAFFSSVTTLQLSLSARSWISRNLRLESNQATSLANSPVDIICRKAEENNSKLFEVGWEM